MSSHGTQTTKPLRVGIVGTGFGITSHLPACRAVPEVEVTAILSSDRSRADAVAREYGIPHAFHDIRRLAESSIVDLVIVASVPELHCEQTVAFLEAGKHVLCEKPMGSDIDEVRTMVSAGREAGVIHAVNFEFRYLTVNQRVRQVLRSAELGRPLLVVMGMTDNVAGDPRFKQFWWGRNWEREKGGGSLMLLHSHYIDLLFSWFGGFSLVHGTMSTFFPTRPVPPRQQGAYPDVASAELRPVDVEDAAAFTAKLPEGGLLSFSGSWSVRHSRGVNLEVYGERGTMIMKSRGRGTDATQDQIHIAMNDASTFEPVELVCPPPGVRDVVLAMTAQLRDIVRDVIDGTPGPGRSMDYADFEDGLRVHEVIEGILNG